MPSEFGKAELVVRPARTGDVVSIRRLVDLFTLDRRLLSKATVALYEDVPEFMVAEIGGRVVGCGALHVMWEDLAEVRTLAVDPAESGKGIGSAILSQLLRRANEFGVERVFVLTFEVAFFERFGFEEIDGAPVSHAVFEQLLQSYDEGVAEFLDLERVKPNTLGNSRLLLLL
ncbi:MAG: amino-acid N-acetyltransferase [Actinomycetes bacterium]